MWSAMIDDGVDVTDCISRGTHAARDAESVGAKPFLASRDPGVEQQDSWMPPTTAWPG